MSEVSLLALLKWNSGGWALDPAWNVLEDFLEEETELSPEGCRGPFSGECSQRLTIASALGPVREKSLVRAEPRRKQQDRRENDGVV